MSNGAVDVNKDECMNRWNRLDNVSFCGLWTASHPCIEPNQKLLPSTNPEPGEPDESKAILFVEHGKKAKKVWS